MKKYHLILVSSLVFILLFYKETIGLNVGVFGLFLLGLVSYNNRSKFKDSLNRMLFGTSFLSCVAFAWYADFASFLALFLSLVFLQFRVQNQELKIIQVIPLLFLNGITSLGRVLMFSQYLPKREINNDFAKKLIAYFVIPAVFLALFFIVYSFGSNHFSSLFTDYYFDINLWILFVISSLGFYISFTFWNYWIPEVCYEKNKLLANNFNDEAKLQNQSTFSFLDIDFERRSGEITLFFLNVLLLIFIVTYNYEQFFEVVEKSKLSADTHERVNAVIFSIVMAIGVILFYFKGGFNFDEKAKNLKQLAKMWIILNAVLIVSAVIKNTEYISHFGLTYKRLGVYAFLGLAIVGLWYSFLKIVKQKTNAFLFNQMLWYFYGLILLCSYVNWGNLISNYNISVNKGIDKEFLGSLNYNDEIYYGLYPEESNDLDNGKTEELSEYQNVNFISKVLYYETLDLK
ncbi:DUF4173 domain-containing protein [Flavobacterium sp. GSA192]|uniref:DUF4153 domain-containing protein n=1 Tax=Flavobacterium sp. GSA192 TaxID=2576304 RepID=UPI00112BC1C0|nr:DUF4173 domain-containing protein [Flavobacterium sp. GSA192]